MRLYDHQVEAVRTLIPTLKRVGGAYLAHDVGTGKTLTALCLVGLLPVKRVIVLAPLVGLGVWEREVHKWMAGQMDALIVRGVWPQRPPRTDATKPFILITNYDQLVADAKRVSWLISWKPDMLILDEAHYVKSPSAKRTRACFRLAKVCRYRLLLSGTPADHPIDWWSQYRIVAPNDPMWAQPFSLYKQKVSILGGPHGAWVVGVYEPGKNEALAAMMKYTHAASPKINAPEPITTVVPVHLSEKEEEIYDSMRRFLFADLPDGQEVEAKNILVRGLRLHQITSGWVTTVSGETKRVGTSKAKAVEELLRMWSSRRVIVACRFTAEVEAYTDAARRIGFTVSVIDGSTPAEERQRIEEDFQRSTGRRALVMQQRAGGISITLTAADAMIIPSFDLSSIVYQQTIGRVWRIGQDKAVHIYPVVARGTVDEAILHGLANKVSNVGLATIIARHVAEEEIRRAAR